MKIDERGVVKSNSANLCGIGMLGLSHGFIKILDEEMDRLQNICCMLYMRKGNIGYQEDYIRSGMRPGVNAVKGC